MIDKKIVKLLKDNYTVVRDAVGQYDIGKDVPTRFRALRYEIKKIGLASESHSSRMLGLIRMESFAITPIYVDGPMLSYERVIGVGFDRARINLHRTVLKNINLTPLDTVLEKYKDLPGDTTGDKADESVDAYPQSLAKIVDKKDSARLEEMLMEYFETFIDILKKTPHCDKEEKNKFISSYFSSLKEAYRNKNDSGSEEAISRRSIKDISGKNKGTVRNSEDLIDKE